MIASVNVYQPDKWIITLISQLVIVNHTYIISPVW